MRWCLICLLFNINIISAHSQVVQAVSDTVDVKPNSSVNIDVLRNDSDHAGERLTVVAATQGLHSERVVINGNGTVHYRPQLDYEGDDVFSYTLSNAHGDTMTAQVFVTVIDRAPVVNRTIRSQSFFLDEHVQIDLGGARPVIHDPQDEPLRLTAMSQDSTIAIAILEGYQLSIVGQQPGRTQIQITGTDSIRQSASVIVQVLVKDPAPKIGEISLGRLINAFESNFNGRDLIALTGPVTIDTLGGNRKGNTYLSSLTIDTSENEILLLRQNYEQIIRWQHQMDIRVQMSVEHTQTEEDTVEIGAHLFFEPWTRVTDASQPFIDRPPMPISFRARKISSGWVVDNMPYVFEQVAQMIDADLWPKITWKIPDLILSVNSPPIVINLNAEPRFFQDPQGNDLTYTTHLSFITGFQGIEAIIQDTLLTLRPVSWGDDINLILSAHNVLDIQSNIHTLIHVKREVPVAVADTAQVMQGESVDIAVLENDRPLANETLQVISTTLGAKSDQIEIVSPTHIRYTPKTNAVGSDRFTYRVDDGNGNLVDGFVFMTIQAREMTPDFNADGQVNFSDFLLFATAFGSNDKNYDLNRDGQVNFPDFVIFGQAFKS